MASLDIGIDLGTYTILASDANRGIILKEPSVVAVDKRSDKVIGIGEQVYRMLGRSPDYIAVIQPLVDGVVSDYRMTGVLVDYMLKKACKNTILRPRVTICVPSAITYVEAQAVKEAAENASARKVYLLEEPVAAAIGAGIDLTKPVGTMIVDIGGGTSDVAVLSLSGIVCKASVRVAGAQFTAAIVKHMRTHYNLLVGERTAEEIKAAIGSVYRDAPEATCDAKGRDLLSGLPARVTVSRSELYEPLLEVARHITICAQSVLERTPPELVGDIRERGILMTGGGSLLHGFAGLLAEETKVATRIAENPVECVALGTAHSFPFLETLNDGLVIVK